MGGGAGGVVPKSGRIQDSRVRDREPAGGRWGCINPVGPRVPTIGCASRKMSVAQLEFKILCGRANGLHLEGSVSVGHRGLTRTVVAGVFLSRGVARVLC